MPSIQAFQLDEKFGRPLKNPPDAGAEAENGQNRDKASCVDLLQLPHTESRQRNAIIAKNTVVCSLDPSLRIR